MARLLPLFHDAFGRGRFTASWLARKYACEHGGVAGFACVALSQEGHPAGSVGVLPWPVRYGDLVETAGQMVDVATGSEHRGRGLFVRLAEMAREVCEKAGVRFLFGFPNEAAYPIWMSKLGYQHIHDLVDHRARVRALWAERLARKVGPLRAGYERYVDRTLAALVPEDTSLQNSLIRDGFAGVDHDDSFLAYKRSFAGSRVVALDGGRVWLNVRHGVLVGDMEAASADDFAATTSALERLARRLGAHQVLFQASEDTRFTAGLAEAFTGSRGMPVIYRDIASQIPSDMIRFSFGDFDNF